VAEVPFQEDLGHLQAFENYKLYNEHDAEDSAASLSPHINEMNRSASPTVKDVLAPFTELSVDPSQLETLHSDHFYSLVNVENVSDVGHDLDHDLSPLEQGVTLTSSTEVTEKSDLQPDQLANQNDHQ